MFVLLNLELYRKETFKYNNPLQISDPTIFIYVLAIDYI